MKKIMFLLFMLAWVCGCQKAERKKNILRTTVTYTVMEEGKEKVIYKSVEDEIIDYTIENMRIYIDPEISDTKN